MANFADSILATGAALLRKSLIHWLRAVGLANCLKQKTERGRNVQIIVERFLEFGFLHWMLSVGR